MRFAQVIIAGSLLMVGGVRAAGDPSGRLCFVRGEDHGSMNRHPVRIWGDHVGRARKLVQLKGGQKTCVSVPQGKWSLEARSTRLDDPKSSDPNECRSAALVVEVTRSPTVTISVAPLGRGSTYICGWNLE
jgi:hypothetical protein